MELYGVASSRARRALWTFEEIGAPFTFHKIDLSPTWHQEVDLLGALAHGVEEWSTAISRCSNQAPSATTSQ